MSNFSLERSGVISAILDLLQHCENTTLGKMNASVSGNLKTPSTWVRLLWKASVVEPNCQLQIAQNIGPLVRCMCDDTKRLFFRSNKHWGESIYPFEGLICKLLEKSIESRETGGGNKRKIINILLLKHGGLLQTIVQWGFWGKNIVPTLQKS